MPDPTTNKREREEDSDQLTPKRQCTENAQLIVHRMQLPDHVDITCILSVHSGEVFIATKSALLHKVKDCVALIAGHPNETGFKDGNAFEQLRSVSLGVFTFGCNRNRMPLSTQGP